MKWDFNIFKISRKLIYWVLNISIFSHQRSNAMLKNCEFSSCILICDKSSNWSSNERRNGENVMIFDDDVNVDFSIDVFTFCVSLNIIFLSNSIVRRIFFFFFCSSCDSMFWYWSICCISIKFKFNNSWTSLFSRSFSLNSKICRSLSMRSLTFYASLKSVFLIRNYDEENIITKVLSRSSGQS